ncbi:MAG: DUF4338 domain-containing protein, partial [Dehalococcoidia bacterium]|nr:DUF4338 domain-containing protein [Dehalococcoidia bacterium]
IIEWEISLLAKTNGAAGNDAASAPATGIAQRGGPLFDQSRAHVASSGDRRIESKILSWFFSLRSKPSSAISSDMQTLLSYRGRAVSSSDVRFIRELIAANEGSSRRQLSKKLCEAWGWVQANGAIRDMVCRGLMLELHRAGHIELPKVRFVPLNPLAERRLISGVEVDRTPVSKSLRELGELRFCQVRRTELEPLFNGLIQQHHYLGYTQPVGEHLKYLVYAGERLVACFAWSSAARHLGPRDRYIGWSAQARRRNISFLAYNSRYLIMPWVQVKHLASHLLGRMVRMLPQEWERVYGHRVYYAETFVDSSRFRGTCYRASNWVYLGQTTGRGKDDQTGVANRPLKDVLGYALVKDFRKLLSRQ